MSHYADFSDVDLTDRENVRPVFLTATEALHLLAFCERELGPDSGIAEAFGGELPRTFHGDESRTLCRQIVSAINEAANMVAGSVTVVLPGLLADILAREEAEA